MWRILVFFCPCRANLARVVHPRSLFFKRTPAYLGLRMLALALVPRRVCVQQQYCWGGGVVSDLKSRHVSPPTWIASVMILSLDDGCTSGKEECQAGLWCGVLLRCGFLPVLSHGATIS